LDGKAAHAAAARPAVPAPVVVRAVLLDLDDTLLDTRAAFRAAVQHVVDRWMPHLDAAGAEQAVLHWATDPAGHFRAYTRGEQDFTTQRRLRARDLHARFGGPLLDEAAHGLWDAGYEQAFRAAWRLADGTLRLLDTLETAGVRIGAVTNLERAYQQDKLAVVGLAERVPVVVAVDDLGFGKPDPRVFRHACDLLGVLPSEAAYVGDEIDVDARAASGAGLVGVWLDVHATGRQPDDVLVARSLDGIPRLLGLAAGPDASVTARPRRDLGTARPPR
jgi:putative hydrolase of the HAD superfamily